MFSASVPTSLRCRALRSTGLQNGYSAKVLSVTSGKRLGLRAMEALIPTLGLTMVAVENSSALRRFTERMDKRKLRIKPVRC